VAAELVVAGDDVTTTKAILRHRSSQTTRAIIGQLKKHVSGQLQVVAGRGTGTAFAR
jgi:hypothetical protein